MKRLLLSALLLVSLLCGCAGQAAASASAAPASSPVSFSTAAPTPTPTLEPDLDLTRLSSIMVYSEVYNILSEPQEYLGKTIRMKGVYYSAMDDLTKQRYFYVIIQDATACCQQGMEFVLTGGQVYPQDYPPENTEVEVTGVYEGYEDMGYAFYRIAADSIQILQ